ncbi:unnamed protein product, partial [Hapterophycus canaliculatus]
GAGSGVSGGDRGGTDAVDDNLLAEGYSGAVALLHLSVGEGFGLTVLEAFACGCPVIAADIPPVREIAGLLNLGDSDVAEVRGLVLIENPGSATQIWRAVRALVALGVERRAAASEALVRRARVFDSWQPLAEALIKAAVED